MIKKIAKTAGCAVIALSILTVAAPAPSAHAAEASIHTQAAKTATKAQRQAELNRYSYWADAKSRQLENTVSALRKQGQSVKDQKSLIAFYEKQYLPALRQAEQSFKLYPASGYSKDVFYIHSFLYNAMHSATVNMEIVLKELKKSKPNESVVNAALQKAVKDAQYNQTQYNAVASRYVKGYGLGVSVELKHLMQ